MRDPGLGRSLVLEQDVPCSHPPFLRGAAGSGRLEGCGNCKHPRFPRQAGGRDVPVCLPGDDRPWGLGNKGVRDGMGGLGWPNSKRLGRGRGGRKWWQGLQGSSWFSCFCPFLLFFPADATMKMWPGHNLRWMGSDWSLILQENVSNDCLKLDFCIEPGLRFDWALGWLLCAWFLAAPWLELLLHSHQKRNSQRAFFNLSILWALNSTYLPQKASLKCALTRLWLPFLSLMGDLLGNGPCTAVWANLPEMKTDCKRHNSLLRRAFFLPFPLHQLICYRKHVCGGQLHWWFLGMLLEILSCALKLTMKVPPVWQWQQRLRRFRV